MERQRVSIANGGLEAAVAGSGPVTVVFESGLGTPLEVWDLVLPRVIERARTLRYDRRYAPEAGPVAKRTVADLLHDLEALLAALALEPPYVLVGHSWGGVIARLFACAHPSHVAGLVLVDATHEAVDSWKLELLPAINVVIRALSQAKSVQRGLIRQLCPSRSSPGYRARVERRLKDPALRAVGFRTSRAEGAAIRPALAQLRRDCEELPPTPTHVLTAGGVKSKMAQANRNAWQATAGRAANARYTNVPTSGHMMPIDAPEAVTDAIVGVLDRVQPTAR
jgi:pimeloyl-ACP methyl ester carboxylesterase